MRRGGAMVDYAGLYNPYAEHIQRDSEAGRKEAQDLIVAREMLEMCPVDCEIEAAFMESFGRLLQGWEARL